MCALELSSQPDDLKNKIDPEFTNGNYCGFVFPLPCLLGHQRYCDRSGYA